jgi:hypothetical protein
MRAPADASVFAQIGGADSSGIALTGNSIGSQQQAVRYADGASENSTTKMD